MNINLSIKRLSRLLAILVVLFISLLPFKAKAQGAVVKNIVIVHGAFADGSGWRGVYDILVKKGYNVTIVQIAYRSFKDDLAAIDLALDKQDGPVILVGHSSGGTLITQTGVHPKVAALVYVSGFMPDIGESTLTWAKTLPAAPENGLLPPDSKGYVYYDKAKFRAGFCADLSQKDADFMFACQGSFFGEGFGTAVTEAAWKTKPSFGIVAIQDKSINPDIERNMYKRAGAIVTEINSSHVSFMSHPSEVAAVIVAASKVGSK
jgi:pimeloyl-ACP methyl ester carboxylesterase